MSETQLSPEIQGRHAGLSKNMEVPPSLITITLSGNKRNVSPEDSNNGVRSPTCEEKAITPFTPSVISEEDQLNRKARLFNLERDLPQSIQVNCNQHVETDNISSVDMSFCESLHWHIDNSTPDFVVQEAIRKCIKQKVFRLLKFCDRDIHGCFNESSKSVCGIVLKFCNLKKAAIAREKWIELRPMVMRAHATHRNNCIKSLQKRYKGKWNAERVTLRAGSKTVRTHHVVPRQFLQNLYIPKNVYSLLVMTWSTSSQCVETQWIMSNSWTRSYPVLWE